ncbi:MAG: GspH/FimT family pseudopilin [Pseudomonadota bacterium]
MRGFRRHHGFTLIELLVTISIAVILMTLAVPSFMDFVRNNRLTAQTNDLVLAFAYARSEAVKRGVRVTVCSRSSDTACAASTTWDGGWLVFVDNNGNGTCDSCSGGGGDLVLQAHGGLDGGNTLRANGAFDHATFNSNGFSSGFAATLTLCDSRGADEARAVILSNQGRTRQGTDGADADSIVEDGSGSNVSCPP